MEQFNKFVEAQDENKDAIKKLLVNMKKDSASRKTTSYVISRTATLEKLWGNYQSNHEAMLLAGMPNHEYFKNFDDVKQLYEETKSHLEAIEASAAPQPIDKSKEVDQQQPLRLRKQHIKMDAICITLDQARMEITQNKTRSKYEYLRNKIMKQWESIEAQNEEIQLFESKFEDEYFVNNKFINIELEMEDTINELDEKINIQSDVKSHSNMLPNITLPQIKIPVFEGNYENWSGFHDIFEKVINSNNSLSKPEKMQYLKTYVKGEASRSIQHLQISEGNYDTAWTLLKKRYQNSRLLLSTLLDKILEFPRMQSESANKLKELYDTVNECLEAIKNLKIDTTTWGPIINRIIVKKWDQETNKLYEQSLTNPQEVQSFETLMKFLMTRFQSLEAISKEFKDHDVKTSSNNKPKTGTDGNICKYCELSHSIYSCYKFKSLSPVERFQAIKERKLCTNCLSHDINAKCHSTWKCHFCKQSHHSLLHRDENKYKNNSRKLTNTVLTEEQIPQTQLQNTVQISNCIGRHNDLSLLPTALVQVKNNVGTFEYLRALIDTGSEATLITERAAQQIGTPRERIRAEVIGLGDGNPKIASYKTTISLSPRFSSNYILNLSCIILPKLTQTLPRQQLNNRSKEDWCNYILADPTYNRPGPIDMIIGIQEISKIILDGIRKSNGILGQNTEFGWVLSGSIQQQSSNEVKIVSMITQVEEDSDLTKFWELEEVQQTRSYTQHEQACEEFFQQTTKRNTDGSYTVRIPFKTYPMNIGNSRSRAVARLLQLEKKLSTNESLSKQYQQFIKEYIHLGHMKKVTLQDGQAEYFIPHQAVINETGLTTKFRVVFDASSTTSTGISLNQFMHTGPRLQQELSDILLRWRKHTIVFSADIEKMYRQIKIQKMDQKFQRILWRFDQADPIEEYKLTTVTYGTTSAPYLAIRVLQQLAADEQQTFPNASNIAQRDFYVDDVLSGENTVEKATRLQEELIGMLKAGGFKLRKWSSNNKALQNLPEELVDLSTDETRKSLGVHWAPHSDKLHFKVKESKFTKWTKRHILAEVARLFDPLGLLAPIVIRAKLLIQELWINNLEWDQDVPSNILCKWTEFYSQLKAVETYVLPRWIHFNSDKSKIELHAFCDASEKAYGVSVYSRVICTNGEVKITLLTAKSKVAPAKNRATLPRLELCAAVLLAKLVNRLIKILEIDNIPVYNWTDSMIVLSWIKGDPLKWKTFVANRVVEINYLLPSGNWRHVRSEENPADLISRGTNPEKLQDNSLWWNGPTWLQDSNNWPVIEDIKKVSLEEKVCHQTNIKPRDPEIISHFSKFSRMIRVTSYCYRFINNSRMLGQDTGMLTVQELETTLKKLVKLNQDSYMGEEIKLLKQQKPMDKNNKLATLNPFLDEDGIIRVGGRLENSALSYNEKHPIILSNKSHLSELIIDDAHAITLHGGNQMVLAYIRRKFWIINGKQAVRGVIKKCPTCRRYEAQTMQQQMGNLPSARVTPHPPFTHTGVDYAGPIPVRASKGRGYKTSKGYIAIFVCLTTKAIHIEVVSDMSTDTFLAAFRRFTSRRGNCLNMYSDNGTNFVGASRILNKEVTKLIRSKDIQEKLSTIGTKWQFIPPAAPHFGGIWEAGVKSIKFHFKRIVGNSTLTFEELTTLMTQIEACLNSRPLCSQSEDINDTFALTPGHFLIGREIITPPDPITTNINSNLSSRWQLVQKMKKDFWKAWSQEYLSRLQQRYKWKNRQINAQVGDLVIIKDDNLKPSEWPLARIIEVHPAKDDSVRVVTIKKSGGTTLQRSIHGLIPLPSSQNTQLPSTTNTSCTNTILSTMKPNKERKQFPSKNYSFVGWIILILLTIASVSTSVASFTILHPKPGLYVEHLGQSKIERGTFRVDIQFEKSKIDNDGHTISDIISRMTTLCQKAAIVSTDTQYTALLHHLRAQEQQFNWLRKSMEAEVNYRQKRGLLGKLLTSVFGVNDEVYQDIEALDTNQQKLIKNSNDQTKFMLSALSTFNDTKVRIEKQLEHFRFKLNQGLSIINNMQKWFSVIDSNKLSIHVLGTFQVASTYIDDTLSQYTKLVNVHQNRGSIYDFISPAHVREIIDSASNKLPSQITILPAPVLRTSVNHSTDFIHVYGYFPITETSDFMLIKATPIPLKIVNGCYWILDVPNEIIAVNYDSQVYFQLSTTEFNNCVPTSTTRYLCSPTAVRNLENSPNCIIDEIYQRTSNTTCNIIKQKMSSPIIWKQVYIANTWMFICSAPTKVGVICNNIREDASLNLTGLIQIGPECVIKTKQNILTATRFVNSPVIEGFTHHVPIKINESWTEHKQLDYISKEPVLAATDQLAQLENQQEDIQRTLDNSVWKTIRHHSIVSSIITAIVVIVIILVLWLVKHGVEFYLLQQQNPPQRLTQIPMVPLRPSD